MTHKLVEPELVLAAFRQRSGLILCASGLLVEAMIEAIGPHTEQIGLTNGFCPKDGIWVWEGKPTWKEKPFEGKRGGYTTYEDGAWREPHVHEWSKIVAGQAALLWPTRNPLKQL